MSPFGQDGEKVLLTQAGEQFLASADKIFPEMASARAELDELSEWGRGRLRIGASAAACQYILPPVLRKFQKKFAKCRLNIVPGDTAEIVDALRENQIDIAVTLEPQREPGFEFKPLFADELVFIVNPKHAWAGPGRALRTNSTYFIFVPAARLNSLRAICVRTTLVSSP